MNMKISVKYFNYFIMLLLFSCGGEDPKMNPKPDTPQIKFEIDDFSNTSDETKKLISENFNNTDPVVLINTKKKTINELLDYLDIEFNFATPIELENDKILYYGLDTENDEYWEIICTGASEYIRESLSYTDTESTFEYTKNSEFVEHIIKGPTVNSILLLNQWIERNNNRKTTKVNNIVEEINHKRSSSMEIDLIDSVKNYHKNWVVDDPLGGVFSFDFQYVTVHQTTTLNEEIEWFYIKQECTLAPKTKKDENIDNPKFIENYIKKYDIAIGKIDQYEYKNNCPDFSFKQHLPDATINEKKITYSTQEIIGKTVQAKMGALAGTENGFEINGEYGTSTSENNLFGNSVEYSIKDVKFFDHSNNYAGRWKYIMDDSNIKMNEDKDEIVFPCHLSSSTFSPQHTCIFQLNPADINGFSVALPVHFNFTYKSAFVVDGWFKDYVDDSEEKTFEARMYLLLPITNIKERLEFKIDDEGKYVKFEVTSDLNHISKCEWLINNTFTVEGNIEDNCAGEFTFYEEGYHQITLKATDYNGIEGSVSQIYPFYATKFTPNKNSIDFGYVCVGEKKIKSVKITNIGNDNSSINLNFSCNLLDNCEQFKATINSDIISPNETVRAYFTFTPKEVGFIDSTLEISGDHVPLLTETYIQVKGTGVDRTGTGLFIANSEVLNESNGYYRVKVAFELITNDPNADYKWNFTAPICSREKYNEIKYGKSVIFEYESPLDDHIYAKVLLSSTSNEDMWFSENIFIRKYKYNEVNFIDELPRRYSCLGPGPGY